MVEITEDRNVTKAIDSKIPILDLATKSPASTEIRRLAHWMIGKEFTGNTGYGFVDWLVGWMTK